MVTLLYPLLRIRLKPKSNTAWIHWAQRVGWELRLPPVVVGFQVPGHLLGGMSSSLLEVPGCIGLPWQGFASGGLQG